MCPFPTPLFTFTYTPNLFPCVVQGTRGSTSFDANGWSWRQQLLKEKIKNHCEWTRTSEVGHALPSLEQFLYNFHTADSIRQPLCTTITSFSNHDWLHLHHLVWLAFPVSLSPLECKCAVVSRALLHFTCSNKFDQTLMKHQRQCLSNITLAFTRIPFL